MPQPISGPPPAAPVTPSPGPGGPTDGGDPSLDEAMQQFILQMAGSFAQDGLKRQKEQWDKNNEPDEDDPDGVGGSATDNDG